MPDVHVSAVLEGDVQLGEDVVVGPWCVIQGPAVIGNGTRLIGNVYLHGPITLGQRNTIYPFACLGFAPQHARFDPETPGQGLVIGDGNTFREHSTVHRAFTEDGPTRIGDNNLFMAGAHAGHDCRIGSDCTLVNDVLLGGHVELRDNVTVGGGTVLHQFCRVGRGAMLSGGMGASNDIPPWFTLTGINVCATVNLIGMRRAGLSSDDIDDVRWAHRTLYRQGLAMKRAIDALRERRERPMIAEILTFIDESTRRICGATPKSRHGGS